MKQSLLLIILFIKTNGDFIEKDLYLSRVIFAFWRHWEITVDLKLLLFTHWNANLCIELDKYLIWSSALWREKRYERSSFSVSKSICLSHWNREMPACRALLVTGEKLFWNVSLSTQRVFQFILPVVRMWHRRGLWSCRQLWRLLLVLLDSCWSGAANMAVTFRHTSGSSLEVKIAACLSACVFGCGLLHGAHSLGLEN